MSRLKKLLSLCTLILPGLLVFPQTTVFDVFKYSEPPDWKKELRKDLVIYTDINTSAGTYGQIGLYANRNSTDNAKDEFLKDWNELIIPHYSVPEIPGIEVSTIDAFWKMSRAAVPASTNGQNFTLKMVTYSGMGKTATIIATYNSDIYKRKIDQFLLSIEMTGQSTIQTGQEKSFNQNENAVDKNDQYHTAEGTLSGNQATNIVNVTPEMTADKNNSQSYGNLIYNLPSGWEQQLKSNYISVFPSQLKQGEILEIRILQPVSTSDFNNAAASTWQEISQQWNEDFYNDIFPGRIHDSFFGWQYFVEKRNTRRFNGLDTEIGLFMIANGNKIERCITISDEFRVQGLDYMASTRFFDDINNIVYSIRIAGKSGEKTTVPSLHGDRITGVWTGLSGGFSGYSGTYDQKTFFAVFFTNGIVYFRDRLPDHGLYQLNPMILQNVYPDYWCAYSLTGDQGIIKSNYYNNMPITLIGNKLTITKNKLDHSYSKLTSPDGMRLKGTWAFETGESLTLNPDGSFTDNGALGIMEHSLYYKPYTVTANTGNGRYEIRDFTVVFTYSDGREFRCSFPAYDIDKNNPAPQALYFGKDDMMRLK